MIAYIMNFVHNDRLRTVHGDIQTVKIDIQVCILIEYIILYGDIPLYTYISFNGPVSKSHYSNKINLIYYGCRWKQEGEKFKD